MEAGIVYIYHWHERTPARASELILYCVASATQPCQQQPCRPEDVDAECTQDDAIVQLVYDAYIGTDRLPREESQELKVTAAEIITTVYFYYSTENDATFADFL